jgi:DNA-binding CsgD family transcriptional regulator
MYTAKFNSNLDLGSLKLGNLEQFMENRTAHVYCKNKSGVYLGVNDNFACANKSQPNDIIGVQNFDDTFGREHALRLMKNDHEVIFNNQLKTTIESVNIDGCIYYYLSYKAPLRTKTDEIIGVFGISFSMNEENEIFSALNEMSALVSASVINKIGSIFTSTCLSQRQLDCVYYLVKGKTMRQIAEKLILSPKTIEHYLEAAKNKLGCHTRSELIEKALQLTEIREKL